MKSPLISIIVLTCNGKEHLEECISALRKQTYSRTEIILVDNGSRDGSAEFVRRRFKASVRVVELSENIGYTGGNNAGIRAARGEYIAFLNDDTRADPRWLEKMYAALEGGPKFGMAAGKIVSYYHPDIIDNVGHLIYRDGTFRGRGRLERDRGQYDQTEEVLAPSGCAFMVRKKILDRVGGFDEDFFIYGDDADLSLRVRLAGWKVIYVPTALVYHKYSATTGAYSPFKAFLVERNRIWLTVKCFPLGALLASPFFVCLRLFFQAYGVVTGRGAAGKYTRQFSALSLLFILIKAHLAALAGLPTMWKKRRKIKSSQKVSNREFYRWLKKFSLSARELALKD